jgi:Flp pilus assembly protein TadG
MRSNKIPRFSEFFSERNGATAVIVALSAGVLAGMWALSFDLGRAWNLQTEMANAADAAALACASQLDQTIGARSRAITAAGAGGLVLNQQTFASDGQGADVAITAANITFFSSLNPDIVAIGDDDANFCQVSVTPRAVNFSFSQMVGGPGSTSPQAIAVAERGLMGHCLVPPLVICNPDEPNPFNAAGHIGDGITLKASGGSSLNKGNFGLLALPQPGGGFSLAASDIADAWGRVRPLHECYGEFVQTKPGQVASINAGMNMRFDVYPTGTHQVPSGEPPVKNNPNYTPSLNSVKGLTKVGGQCAMNNPQGWNDPPNKYMGTLPADMVGMPRDGCAYPDPVTGNPGTCDITAGGTHWGNGNWSGQHYMDINHGGASINTVPDLNGDGNISRWETYQWELTNGLSTNAMEDANPICSSAAVPTQIDRRKVTAAVVNCDSLGGTTITKPDEYVDVFLTEPMGSFNGNNDVYLEVIGPASKGPDSGTRWVVRLVR